MDKGINLHVQPEKQIIEPMTVMPDIKTPPWSKPRIGQGRAGLRSLINQHR